MTTANKFGDETDYDWAGLVADLNRYLRLRTTPIGMKMFATAAEMEAVPRIRRPQGIHATDQIVGQAARLNWTIGVTMADLVGAQCGAVIGLHPQDEDWRSGRHMTGVWFDTDADAAGHQAAMHTVPYGEYEAMAASPLVAGRLDPPDIALVYATPAQMILFINGLQYVGYRNLEWGCVGESACADFAERRYGGVMEDELLMALPPSYLPQIIAGLEQLSKNGLRYPIAPYGVSNDVRAGMSVSYKDRAP